MKTQNIPSGSNYHAVTFNGIPLVPDAHTQHGSIFTVSYKAAFDTGTLWDLECYEPSGVLDDLEDANGGQVLQSETDDLDPKRR
jgi:hypothetical protein